MKRLALPLCLLAALAATPAAAEHEVYYRYTVLGYVTDGAGKPRVHETVRLLRDKTGFSYLGDTDAAGLFVIVARLGDESTGERLTLSVAGTRLALIARFDPANHRDERGTRVDARGAHLVERPAWFHPTLAHVLGDTAR